MYYYAVAKGKVESLYCYSFSTKLKGLCVTLITIINIIKLTFTQYDGQADLHFKSQCE